uniref:Uncharacterized protein n=1 Tax=Setaria digitata TaxID=48799 RepID=A0A915PE13_9BILA
MGFPSPSAPIAAPRMKSTCPPKPERNRGPTESETTAKTNNLACINNLSVGKEIFMN